MASSYNGYSCVLFWWVYQLLRLDIENRMWEPEIVPWEVVFALEAVLSPSLHVSQNGIDYTLQRCVWWLTQGGPSLTPEVTRTLYLGSVISARMIGERVGRDGLYMNQYDLASSTNSKLETEQIHGKYTLEMEL
jgi:hypothetical protein